MHAREILAALAVVFVALAIGRRLRHGPGSDPALRAWLIVVLVFSAVSGWLLLQGR